MIDDAAAPGSVEIDDMEAFQPGRLKLPGDGQRVFVVDGFAAVVALGEADAFTVDEVYSGDDVHGLRTFL
jgi:hypothetical protein